MAIYLILAAVTGYLLGSINTSMIVGKFYGIDVRKHGSGNAGATNTLRTLGKSAALFVSLGDVFKGILACLLGSYIITVFTGSAGIIGIMVAGVAAIIGHNWPIYFGFKGGKGIFTTLAVVIMMDWRIALILLGIFILTVLLTRYVSLGSIIATAVYPVIAIIAKKDITFTIFALIIAILAVFRHRSNISRILKGTESKLGAKKKV